MIVDPWGAVIADAGRRPGLTYATLDLAMVERTRGMIPSLVNERDYETIPAITEKQQEVEMRNALGGIARAAILAVAAIFVWVSGGRWRWHRNGRN